MAVHTPLSEDLISAFVQPYQLGSLIRFKGLTNGIENTNYLVTLENGTDIKEYILTLFEQLSEKNVAFFTRLLQHLAKNGLPVPQPLTRPDTNTTLQQLANKPALLLSKLPGAHLIEPDAEHCYTLGQALARQHLATADLKHDGDGALDVIRSGEELSLSNHRDQQLLSNEIQNARTLLTDSSLPYGLIHGDLFRDNVLFEETELTGLLDYYSATMGPLLFDVAVTINDWCVTDDRKLDPTRVTALLEGYNSIRPLTPQEHDLLPQYLRAAALRFWISRLHNQNKPLITCTNIHVPRKDPNEFRDLLLNLATP